MSVLSLFDKLRANWSGIIKLQQMTQCGVFETRCSYYSKATRVVMTSSPDGGTVRPIVNVFTIHSV